MRFDKRISGSYTTAIINEDDLKSLELLRDGILPPCMGALKQHVIKSMIDSKLKGNHLFRFYLQVHVEPYPLEGGEIE